MLTLGTQKGIAAGSLTIAAGALFAMVWYRRYLKNKPPVKWMTIGRVTDLYLYPIKSCKGLKPDEFVCTPLGPKIGELRDRMFVVIDAEGKFVTGREQPMLTQVKVSLQDGKIAMSMVGGSDGVEFELGQLNGDPQKVKIWESNAEGVDCGDDVAGWLSRNILKSEKGLRLLYHAKKEQGKSMNPRMTKVMDVTKMDFREKDSAFYSDAVSYLLISEASIGELNQRIADENVTHLNFRPNIVISGEKLIPFEEDGWDWMKIGDVVFRILTPSTRCLFTTVDPETGRKSEKREPLATLQRYRFVRDSSRRKVMTSPAMGVYMGARSDGVVHLGDEVMIPAV